ncbi:cell adhesion molecule Dscam1 isoform X2 [Penaeus vannamei]|uniref:cell adhesion molecule Dscam1 isoform X2 n=1 Tax=Penaeus vannamei TaxID=6689 RepID=UPI00387F6FFB
MTHVASLKNLQPTIVTGTFVQLEWESDGNGTGMEPEFEVAWGAEPELRLRTHSARARLTDLQPGTRYSITIRSVSRGSARGIMVRLQTASLRLTQSWGNQLQVAWNSAFANPRAVRMMYKVQWNITSRALSSNYTFNQTTIVNSTEAEIMKIRVPYYAEIVVCVQARRQKDEWSRKACDSVTTQTGTPGNVRNLKITPDERSLRVTWEDPDDTPPTGELDRVSIEVSNTCKSFTSLEPIRNLSTGSGKRFFIVKHLQPDSDYAIKVRALNKGLSTSKSVSANSRTLPGVPSSPRALLALPWSSTQVLLSWAPPEEPQGILVNYTVSVDGKVGTCKEDTLQVHRCEINGFTPGENYRTEVEACNRLHCSSAVATEVAMPSERVLPVWIPVLLAFLLFIVLGLLPFMLWRSKKLVDHLNERIRLTEAIHAPATNDKGRPGEEAVLASDNPAKDQAPNPDPHEYDDPYTLGVAYTPQVNQGDILLGEDQKQNRISEAVYANILASSEHQYANIHVATTCVISR